MGERVTIYDRNERRLGLGPARTATAMSAGCPAAALATPGAAPTHKVAALRTFAFPGPSIKLPPVETLPLGAQARRSSREDGAFAVTRERLAICRGGISAPIDAMRDGFRRGGRALPRHALSVGRQDQPRHRLLRPGAGGAERLRHRLPARQRHAAGRRSANAGAGGAAEPAARRPDLLEGPCRDRARRRHHRSRQRASHGDRDREHPRGDRAHQGRRQRESRRSSG